MNGIAMNAIVNVIVNAIEQILYLPRAKIGSIHVVLNNILYNPCFIKNNIHARDMLTAKATLGHGIAYPTTSANLHSSGSCEGG